MRITRRTALKLTGGAALALGAPLRLGAATGRRHALAVFGDALHGPDFTHFGYVNPEAPRGGELRMIPPGWMTNQNPDTFNTFNMLILRGDSPPFMQLCQTSLMVRGLDEPDAVYGHIAEAVEIDGLRHAFALRPEATFSDGSPITAEDVAFSYDILRRQGHYEYVPPLDDVASVEAADPRTAVITFRDTASTRMPPLIATYPIVSKAYYTQHDFTAATLDVPVTSGPYVVGDFQPGTFVAFAKRPDYWGDAVPSGRGHNNFERIRVDFFRERAVAFEAFKAGQIRFREEFTSKTWATEYTFPAVRDGRVVLREFPDGRPAGAQGYFINTRRRKLADRRTREALTFAFDFEWTNANLFYGAYTRTQSYFMNSDMMAEGAPGAAELALLEPFRDRLDAAVFGPAWTAPVTDGSGRDRDNLRRAAELLAAAGWVRDGNGLVDADGERLTVEYLYQSEPASERVFLPFAQRLGLLGIDAQLRPVDAATYQTRVTGFDYDLVSMRFALAPTPDESIRVLFTSAAAAAEGSRNLPGIADPVVDALVEAVLAAATREDMLAATRALDRVLRLGHYWVPQFGKGIHTVAHWDRFGMPEAKPRFDLPVETTWWAKDA